MSLTSAAQIFLEALFAGKPDHSFILIWTMRGEQKASRWFRDVNKAAAYVASLTDCNVYVGIGLSPSDFGTNHRCESDQISGIVGFGADIDLHSDAHPKGALPKTLTEALLVLPSSLPPSIVVETGNGLQCWWLFKEPWIFNSPEDRQQAATLSSRVQTLLKYNAQNHGWRFDRLKDLARVLRVPGTQNVKDPASPKNVIIRSLTEHRCDPSEFRNYLDDLSIPDEDTILREAKAFTERSRDENLLIDFAAAIPDHQLASWLEQDPRFHQTWNHQRTDLNDTTQSGYDLALAAFGVRNGLANQQLINLIVHNRRIYGAQQSKSLPYYTRTISKARNGAGAQTTPTSELPTQNPGLPNAVPLATGQGQSSAAAADPNSKAKLCQKISNLLGVCVLRIVKVMGGEPAYLMELDNTTIHFPDTNKLLSSKFMKSTLAGMTGKVIRRFKPWEWDQITQMMLDACTEKEGTDDLEFTGAGRLYINQYLADHTVLGCLEGQSQSMLLCPVVDKGKIAISAMHFQQYINKTMTLALSVKYYATMIAALGGESVRVRAGRIDQARWALPIAEWNPKNYDKTGEGSSDA